MRGLLLSKFVLFVVIVAVAALAACNGSAPTPTQNTAPTNALAPTRNTLLTNAPAPATNVPTEVPAAVQSTQAPTLVPSGAEGTQPSNNPTTAPAPTNPTVASDAEIPSGVTAEGYYYLGNPNAKVTLIDYSDFL